MKTGNVTVGSWYIPTHHATSVQARTRRDMAREGKSGKRSKSAREMQNSSIAHIRIGSTLEDDITHFHTTNLCGSFSDPWRLRSLSQEEQQLRVFDNLDEIICAIDRRNENKETSSDFHCCVTHNSNIK
jgi:hypothetical protein